MTITLMVEADYGNDVGRLRVEECILNMAGGDSGSMAVLYERTKTAVYGFALSIVRNQADAEDVLQDTYVRIYQAADRYKPNGNPMPWIFTIARHLALMKLRERGKQQELPEDESLLVFAKDSQATSEDRVILQVAMTALNEEERQILMLHAVAGLKHREIAQLMGMALSTVLSKYNRTLKKMRRKLGEEEQA